MTSLGQMGGYAWRELRRRKSRTATTILGYFLAVSVTIGLIAVMLSQRAADRVLGATGTHFVACAPADALPGAARPLELLDPDGEGFIAAGNHALQARLLSTEVLSAVRAMPTIKDASGALVFRFRDPADGHAFSVAGIDPGGSKAVTTSCCAARDVLRGRFLDPKGEREAMVEEAYAKAHHLDVGHAVSVAATPFPVVGIVNSGMRAVKADVYLPFAEAERVVGSRVKSDSLMHRFNVLMVEASSSDAREDAAEQVKAVDRGLVISGYACYRPAVRVMGMNETGIRILIVIVAIGVVLFAAISQVVSVAERRADIGVLKAIGWTGREVVAMLLTESVIQGLIGGLLGGVVAAGGLAISSVVLPAANPIATTGDLLLIGGALSAAVLLAVVGGMLAGVIPACLSARISPAEAFRRL